MIKRKLSLLAIAAVLLTLSITISPVAAVDKGWHTYMSYLKSNPELSGGLQQSTTDMRELPCLGSIKGEYSLLGSTNEDVCGGGAHSISILAVSYSRHVMCKDHDGNYNPVNPTTIFSPNDYKAECLTTVDISSNIKFKWYYRSDSAKSWDYYGEWSWSGSGSYNVWCYIYIIGKWPGSNYPRGWKLDVYLDGSYFFYEFFEITDGGLTKHLMCDSVDGSGNSINEKYQFIKGVNTTAYHYVRLDNIAYFNDETGSSHVLCIFWYKPDGTIHHNYLGYFPDYKDLDPNYDYWSWGYVPDDYLSIDSSTPTGDWKVEIYIDKYYDGSWMWYGPVATTSFSVIDQLKSWTFMVYADGDNNLESYALAIFNEMASIGSTSQVNLVVQLDRAFRYSRDYGDWTDCKRFYITQGMKPTPEKALQSLGEVNMGDPKTLKDFINWAAMNYPAVYYCLVLYDHGSGTVQALGLQPKIPLGVCFDDSSGGDCLTLPELSQALAASSKRMNIVFFDACDMGMVEVASQIREYADFMVATEEVGWTPGPYQDYLTSLIGNSSISPRDFACVIPNKYISWIGNSVNATMSAVDLSMVANLEVSTNSFAQILEDKMGDYQGTIISVRDQTEGYEGPYLNYYGYYVDLYHFSQLIQQQIPDAQVKGGAGNVMVAISQAVICERHSTQHANSHGLSIFFPTSQAKYNQFVNAYNATIFAGNRVPNWTRFLQACYTPILLRIITITSSPTGSGFVKVDGSLITTPQTFTWKEGSTHMLEALSPVSGGSGTQYVWTSWSDEGSQSHTYIVPYSSQTVTASYKVQYNLSFTALGLPNGVSVTLTINSLAHTGTTPYIYSKWFDSGSSVSFNASSSILGASGTAYFLIGWEDESNNVITSPVNATAPHIYSAQYKKVYVGTIIITLRESAYKAIKDAQIYLDGNYVGLTDSYGKLVIQNVPTGSHAVKATKEGYNNASKNVTIRKGINTNVAITMSIKTFTLTIYVKDSAGKAVSNAYVYLDGSRKGTTDKTGKLTVRSVAYGQHTILVRKSGYLDYSTIISVTSNIELNIVLQK